MLVKHAYLAEKLLVHYTASYGWLVTATWYGRKQPETIKTARSTVRAWASLDTLVRDFARAGCEQLLEIDLLDLRQQKLDLR